MARKRSSTVRHNTGRYGAVAIALHWLMATVLVAQLGLGLWMVEAVKLPTSRVLALQATQWHRSLGLTLLILGLIRLSWRLLNPPPPLPESMSWFEKLAAAATHLLLYGLMIAIPVLGWAMVSATPLARPTRVFGIFAWPHFPWVQAIENKAAIGTALKLSHRYAAYVLLLIVGLHVAAALRHHFVNRDNVLARMLPWARSRIGSNEDRCV